MSRVQTHGIVLIVLLTLLSIANYKFAPESTNVDRPDMQAWLPLDLDPWRGYNLDPAPIWNEQLPAANFMVRAYEDKATEIEFLMIESADPGTFHSPMFCLPGAGWSPIEAGPYKLPNGEVSRAEFKQDFESLTVRYWYLAGEKMTASLWKHKLNMLVNKLQGVDGPNFSFRITVRRPGDRKAPDAANEFADLVLKQLNQKIEADRVASAKQ